MACGHTFTNYATTCRTPSNSRPCTPNVKIQHLNDTCAACDPAVRRRRVRQDFENRQAELVKQYITAKKTGDFQAMMHVEELVMKNVTGSMERNFEISMPMQEEDVMWWEMD
ncbi:hypothetical protein NW762_002102 [Fusarium torreyae]|uniref:Uncharacterized protein n=1 Tax=Fusarium torreyae TaxID=1237075 RepID=A0A9W8SFX0_9HYPO|nr:hypothetical protein NW762_002102 [Fusarium torreyae]